MITMPKYLRTQATFSQRKKSTVNRDIPFITEMGLFNILDKLHHTAEGADGIPAWYLRLRLTQECLPILSISRCRHLLYQSSGRWLSSILWLKYHYLPLLLTFDPYLLLQFCVD